MRKKLKLNRETVRVLTGRDLTAVAGGYPVKSDWCPPSNLPSALCGPDAPSLGIVCVALLIALACVGCAVDTGMTVQREDSEEGEEGPCPDEGGDCWHAPPYSAGWCADHPGDILCVPASCAEDWTGTIDWSYCWSGSTPPNQWGSSWTQEFACELDFGGHINWSQCHYTGSSAPGWVPCGQAPSACNGWDRDDWGGTQILDTGLESVIVRQVSMSFLSEEPSQSLLAYEAGGLLNVEKPVPAGCWNDQIVAECCVADEEAGIKCCVRFYKQLGILEGGCLAYYPN